MARRILYRSQRHHNSTAVETLIYLKEVRRIKCLSQIIAEFGSVNAELQALGITKDEDAWSRYAFKLRKQVAPGLIITDRAFGTGWRMPIACRWG